MGLAFTEVEVNGARFKALVDTGFNGDLLVSRRVAEELKLPIIGEGERKTVDGRVVKTRVSYAKVTLLESEGFVIVEVLEEMPLDVLVGVRALEALGYLVDPSTGTLKRVGLIAV